MRIVLEKKVMRKIKTHILVSINFSSRKLCRWWENVEKYGWAWHSTDENIMRRGKKRFYTG